MKNRLRACLVTALLGTCFGLLQAEVSTLNKDGKGYNTLVTSIIEDSDPVPTNKWKLHYAPPTSSVLNPLGEPRTDGRPDVYNAGVSGKPYVVWAYDNGTDHDIAFSTGLTNSGWTPMEFLTSSTVDELDPRVFVEPNGAIHVVWWEDTGSGEVYLLTRNAGSHLWSAPVVVTSGAAYGRRPSVAVHQGVLYVVYEQLDNGTGGSFTVDVMVATQQLGNTFTHQSIGNSTFGEALDPIVHSEGTALWVDWKQSDTGLASSEYRNGWQAPITESWTDPSWVGEETVRRIIRLSIVN